jgi:manganese/zinc/iron transport system ATP- binding protein
MNNHILKIDHLSFSYPNHVVLEDVSCAVMRGSVTALIGPNGAGKSTLIKLILKLLKPQSGTMETDTQSIGYVPQFTQIDPSFPVRVIDVVLMGLKNPSLWGLFYTKEDHDKARAILKNLGIEDLYTRPVSSLSGGQKQKMLIARALISNPEFLICDEPFANLDAPSEKDLISIFKKLQSMDKTLLIVHHDLNSLSDIFDHFILLNKSIVSQGQLKELSSSQLSNAYGKIIPFLSTVSGSF